MTTYQLIEVKEVTNFQIGGEYTITTYTVPVDNYGNIPSDYLAKNRVLRNNQMIVFDSEQEFSDWIQQNT